MGAKIKMRKYSPRAVREVLKSFKSNRSLLSIITGVSLAESDVLRVDLIREAQENGFGYINIKYDATRESLTFGRAA